MRLQTRVRRSRTERGAVASWVVLVVGLAAVAGLVLVSIFGVPRVVDAFDKTEESSAETTGTVEIPARARVAAVVVTGAGEESDLTVNVRPVDGGRSLPARVAGPDPATGQFTVLLTRGAPAGGALVTWQVSGLPGQSATGAATWTTEWVVVLTIMVVSLLAALAAYWLAVWRRQAGADGQIDVGPELASFLKVAALLMIGALALIAVMLATEETSLSALFGLFGTIAGYLAGNRSETSGGRGRRSGPGGRPGRDRSGKPKDDPNDRGERQGEQFRMSMPETRSLL